MNNSIQLSVSELKAVLPGFNKIIGKPRLPVLGCLRLTSHPNGSVHLQATNLDDFLSYRMESASASEPVDLLVPFTDLFKVVKSCSSKDQISLRQQEKETILSYPVGNTHLDQKLSSIDLNEWPLVPQITETSIPVGDEFKAALFTALDCASEDSSRYILQSAFIDASDPKSHYVVGTDGKHMFASNSFCFELKQSLIVPDRSFLTWKGFMEDGQWKLCIQAVEKQLGWIQVQSEHWTYFTRQVEGTYPNWRVPIPKQEQRQTLVQFTPEAMDVLLQTVPKLPGADEETKSISLQLGKNNSLVVEAENKAGDQKIAVPIPGAVIQGKPCTIHMDRTFLLKAVKLGLTEVEVFSPDLPIIFRSGGKRLIVAPVRGAKSNKPSAPTQEPPVQPPSTEQVQEPQEENQTMKTVNRIEQHENTTTAADAGTASGNVKEPSLFKQAMDQVEKIKETLKGVVTDLNDLSKLQTQAQKEKRATEKEIETIRDHLHSLQRIRI